jgi:hypothetical protein
MLNLREERGENNQNMSTKQRPYNLFLTYPKKYNLLEREREREREENNILPDSSHL